MAQIRGLGHRNPGQSKKAGCYVVHSVAKHKKVIYLTVRHIRPAPEIQHHKRALSGSSILMRLI